MPEIKNYLVLNSDNKVTNVIRWDGETALTVDEGYTLQEAVAGVFYDIGTVKQEDGSFMYVWADGTLHSEKEEIVETPRSKTRPVNPA